MVAAKSSGQDLIKSFICQEVCGHGGMVEQTTMSSGINYDDWIIIGATRVGIKGRCASKVSEPSVARR